MNERTVTGKQMKLIDHYTIEEIGIPSMVLMERAALSAAEYIWTTATQSDHILAVCGTGNNGADGIAAARMLHLKGYSSEILMVGEENHASEEFKQQLSIARKTGVSVMHDPHEVRWENNTILVDALFGIGLSREVEGLHKEVIQKMNDSQAKVISIDIASGLSGDDGQIWGTAVKANTTVTFGWKKEGMTTVKGKELSGETIVADIGYPEEVYNRFVQ